jgi:Ran GTPase-activating protein (RanGAP) involved in mRNA processing and transport
MQIILNMLKENKSLEKLLIQHNYLGHEGANQMVQALKIHPQMRYLDISANEICSKGFMYFEELFLSNCSLETLHVRKNNIKGEKIMSFPAKLRDNSNLHLLDLQDNRIDTDCAKQLVTLLHDNYFIEDLILKGNNYADNAIIETINEECRKNLLIKEFILPKLTTKGGTFLKDTIVSSATDVHFKNYNVERLEL